MTIDQAMNIDVSTGQLRMISSGSDGDALIGLGNDGREYEWRVLTSASETRTQEVRRQLLLLRMAGHACIRELAEPPTDDRPFSYRLIVPTGVDALRDRLSRRIDGLGHVSRFRIAALLVDACESAHRIGLYHGSFAASTVLVGRDPSSTDVFVDYSAMGCSEDVHELELSIDNDLQRLHRLLGDLLGPVLGLCDVSDLQTRSEQREKDQREKIVQYHFRKAPTGTLRGNSFRTVVFRKFLDGRRRAVLRRWIKQLDDDVSAKSPPTLAQWRSVLDGFLVEPPLDQTINFSQTGFDDVSEIPIGSGSTSQMWSGEATPSLPADVIPATIGRFRIEAKIGEGGMGAVYRGVDPTTDEVVAVKVLRRTGKDIGHSVRRFRKEARLLQDVRNEHVTRLIEVGEDGGLHYLVMEFIDGIDLKTWLAGRSALPESEAIGLMIDLTRSLVDAHAREIIHRDIKPENVLLKLRESAIDREGTLVERPIGDFTLKLSDFGIARHVNQSESMEMTRAGAVMGTPKYMSPEQCKSSDDLQPSADIYSLGVTMFELLTGDVPYIAKDFIKIAAMHCFTPIPSVQKRNAQVTDAAQRIVHRAMAKDPADRFGDASQMLSELLRLQQGDAEPWLAHPKLPERHDGAKIWKKTVSWNLASAPADLWPLVSNTERLNEAIGLPAVEYRTEHDPVVGTRRFGSFTVSGIKVCWEEHPFEWIEGRRMGVLREFSSGPLKWYMSVVTLEPSADGGTKLSHQLRVESRNLLGRVMTTLKMDREGFRNLQRVYRRMDQSIAGKLTARQGGDPFADPTPITRAQSARLSHAIERITQAGANADAANKLESALRTWSPQELASLRPLAIADRLKIHGSAMIETCLLAAHEGILNLRWDVLCPTCRVSADTTEDLSQIKAHTNCEACDVDFQSNLAGAIEMVFQAHPEIRKINSQKYCIGGPVHSPHVVAQVRVDAGERLEVPLDLDSGNYLVRGPRLPRAMNMIVRATAAPSNLEVSLSSLGASSHTPMLRSGRQTITIKNDLDTLHIVRIERTIPRSDVVTAAAALTQPLFRKLFPDQRFNQDNPIATETMTFLTTGIHDVEHLYNDLGDAEAYAAVQRLHAETTQVISGAGGTMVKTIGERMLAAFAMREDAVVAARRIREQRKRSPDPTIRLGIGIHCGPALVTTQNNQLDYFGGTVRAASGLPEHAGCDTLITEAVYTDPSVAEHLSLIDAMIEVIDLPGSPTTRIKRLINADNF